MTGGGVGARAQVLGLDGDRRGLLTRFSTMEGSWLVVRRKGEVRGGSSKDCWVHLTVGCSLWVFDGEKQEEKDEVVEFLLGFCRENREGRSGYLLLMVVRRRWVMLAGGERERDSRAVDGRRKIRI